MKKTCNLNSRKQLRVSTTLRSSKGSISKRVQIDRREQASVSFGRSLLLAPDVETVSKWRIVQTTNVPSSLSKPPSLTKSIRRRRSLSVGATGGGRRRWTDDFFNSADRQLRELFRALVKAFARYDAIIASCRSGGNKRYSLLVLQILRRAYDAMVYQQISQIQERNFFPKQAYAVPRVTRREQSDPADVKDAQQTAQKAAGLLIKIRSLAQAQFDDVKSKKSKRDLFTLLKRFHFVFRQLAAF
eukprot:TRINITY_DN7852_c0_g1_i1.p1 TRINITY_DN7852_c0_g1~~TRINITY_DN7852_c0_g1_i1.p1  ORF type:complete len:244 (+),score=41.26 TRINITY_DN7852_c0_g1_i1:418-1149(+)